MAARIDHIRPARHHRHGHATAASAAAVLRFRRCRAPGRSPPGHPKKKAARYRRSPPRCHTGLACRVPTTATAGSSRRTANVLGAARREQHGRRVRQLSQQRRVGGVRACRAPREPHFSEPLALAVRVEPVQKCDRLLHPRAPLRRRATRARAAPAGPEALRSRPPSSPAMRGARWAIRKCAPQASGWAAPNHAAIRSQLSSLYDRASSTSLSASSSPAGEVGDRARHAQHPVVAARAERDAVADGGQAARPGRLERDLAPRSRRSISPLQRRPFRRDARAGACGRATTRARTSTECVRRSPPCSSIPRRTGSTWQTMSMRSSSGRSGAAVAGQLAACNCSSGGPRTGTVARRDQIAFAGNTSAAARMI